MAMPFASKPNLTCLSKPGLVKMIDDPTLCINICEFSAEPGGPGTVFLNDNDTISSGIGKLQVDNFNRSALVAMTADCGQFNILKSGKIAYHLLIFVMSA